MSEQETIDQPSASASIEGAIPTEHAARPESQAESAEQSLTQEIKVFNPPLTTTSDSASASASGSGSGTPAGEGFFEHTLSDVQSYHASVVARSKKLNEAPLLTSKYREAEKSEREKRKADKWPNTTIRIKFSDGTQVQSVFPSTSAIQPVYTFVRSTLRDDAKDRPFILWQPPRNQYPEHPPPSTQTTKKHNPYKTSIVPPANYGLVRGSVAQGLQGGSGGNESLNELGLVPQSMLMIRWEGNDDWNATGFPAPIKDELKQTSQPLPPPKTLEQQEQSNGAKGNVPGTGPAQGEKKIPKWLQKGLMKKK